MTKRLYGVSPKLTTNRKLNNSKFESYRYVIQIDSVVSEDIDMISGINYMINTVMAQPYLCKLYYLENTLYIGV